MSEKYLIIDANSIYEQDYYRILDSEYWGKLDVRYTDKYRYPITSVAEMNEYNTYYLTANANAQLFLYKGSNYYRVTNILLTSQIIWNNCEYNIDAKTKSIDEFIDFKIYTLIGEKYSLLLNESNYCSCIKSTHVIYNYENFTTQSYDMYILGRYYTSTDLPTSIYPYSSRLLYCKTGNENSKIFYKKLLDYFLGKFDCHYDLIMTIPPKNNKNSALDYISANIFKLSENYEPLKNFGGYGERYDIVKDKFYVDENCDLRGKDIIIIDDIYTTGATITSAINTISQHNPKNITVICFGKTYHINDLENKNVENLTYKCPRCNGDMKTIINRYNKSFCGCSNYPNCEFTGDTKIKDIFLSN